LENRITSILNSDECIEILTPFSLGSYFYTGKIKIDYKGVTLKFDVSVAKCYPLTLPTADNISIIFRNIDLIGLPHINNDGSVCFHPDKDDDFERKFKSEIEGLKTWIYDYFICKKEDDNYTYLIHNTEIDKSSTLYFSDNEKKFKKDEFGTFQYSNSTNYEIETDTSTKEKTKTQTFFRIGFDKDFEDKWSSDLLEKLKLKAYIGFWVYIEDEPIIVDDLGRRKSIENWSQLEKYLPKNFIEHLYKSFKGLNKNFFFENDLYVLLGYKIPNNEGYEVHWDLIKINKIKLPIKTQLVPISERKSGHDKYISICSTDKVIWGNTINSNYERFFGRGKLSESLINSKILIIGCGALGSSLAEILVRSGCRNISLDDFDSVASGNLCRSRYNLLDLNRKKIESLKANLTNISPYVNIFNIPLKLNHYYDMEEWLNKSIDFVFDCSTDTEVTYTFDNINFVGKVFSLSITNKAKDLLCIGGKDITRKTNHFYEFLGNEKPSFFEGAGCGYPTFEANFNDISSLLNVAIMNINHQVETSNFLDNFIISQELKDDLKSLKIRKFYDFFEDSTQRYLYVSNETYSKMKVQLSHHFPKEFGGVFTGVNRGNLTFIDDILVPDKFENGKTVFVRHPGSLNERLQSIFKESNGKVTYIGEWHSHPNSSATPSSTDNVAMREIAENEKIGNQNPVLVIVKITETAFEPAMYIYNDKKLLKYE